MTTIHNDDWQNAQEMAHDNLNIIPPPIESLNLLQKKDKVVICNGYERFKVRVAHIFDSPDKHSTDWNILGIVENDLVCYASYSKGSLVQFMGKNIHKIILSEKIDLNIGR